MKRTNLIFFFCCFLLPVIVPVYAIENLHFEWLNDRQGLSHNTVRALMQDNQGFIWAGTINGLNRYNGREFKTLLPQNSIFVNVADNRIQTIKQDRQGYIWIYTAAQIICCYDTRLEQFIDYSPNDRNKKFYSIRIFSNGDVWLFGDENGCCHIRHTDDGKLQSQHFSTTELGSNSIAFVHEDTNRNVWISTVGGKGLFRMKDGKPELVSSEEFARICEFEGKLYLINTGHIVQYNGKELKKIAGLPRETPEITSATTIDNGVIMIGTPNMIYVFDCRTGKIAPAAPFFEGENIKSANSVIDQKGKAWFYNNTGIIWRQTAGNRFAKIELIPQHIIKTITNERFAVCCDSRGITWITTYGNGLFAFYPDSRIQHFTTKNSELSSDFLLSVMEDNSGEVWVGTESSGINKISLSNLPINIILPKPDGSKHVYDNAVRLIYENAAGQFWIGTRSGDLYLYDHDFNKLQTVNLKDDVPFKMLWRCCAAVNVLPVMKK